MKTLISLKKIMFDYSILVIFFLSSFTSTLFTTNGVAVGGLYAQNIETLLNSEWFLVESEVNDNPIDLNVLGVILYPDSFGDYSYKFEYGNGNTCVESFKVNFTDVTETGFNLSTANEYLPCNFTDTDLIEAVELYLSFYYELPFDENSNPKNPFTYEWVDASPWADELRITNPQGDWLLYRTYTLTTPAIHQDSFTLYPNPVKETLNVNNNSNQAVRATIYDLNGMLLQSHTIENNTTALNVKNLNQGLYFIVFETETGERVSKKFVKR